jgi:hypothetical protein
MTFLPIVERELRVVSRRGSTYRDRVLTPILLAVVVIGKAFLVPNPAAVVASLGTVVFHTLSGLALVYCVLGGVRNTADCLSEEKREGTLGLLFLTDLKGYDVVLGKLAAASLGTFYSLLGMLPILGWSIFLGGVTFGEIGRMGLALMSVLLFSLAMGIWVSSRSRSASRAMGGTICLLLVFLLGPVPMQWSGFAPVSPAYAFFGAGEAEYRSHAPGYWGSLLVSLGLVGCLLARASVTINRFREEVGNEEREEKASGRGGRARAGDAGRRAELREKLLGVNPIYWLANHNLGPQRLVWVLVFMAGMGIGTLMYLSSLRGIWPAVRWLQFDVVFVALVVLMNSAVKVLLASQSCKCFAEARRNSTLEILLSTPLKVEEILQGQALSLKRSFLAPILVLLTFEFVGVGWVLYQGFGGAARLGEGRGFFDTAFFVGVAFIVYFLLDMQGVVWAGVWFGLCSKNESQATFKTVFYVIVLPMLALVLYCIGMVLFVAWPVVSFVWAKLKLQEQFRSLAGQRPTSGGNVSGWLPFEIPHIAEEEPEGELLPK